MRRNSTRALVLAVVLGVLICCAPLVFAQAPVKIGFMAPYVGVYAKLGKDMDNGFKLGLEEAGYKAGGRPITVITEDEGGADLGPTRARKLIEDEKVDIIAGVIDSGVAASIRDIVTDHKIPTIICNAGQWDITGKRKSPYIFRVSFANGQQDLAGGWYAYHKLGMKRIVMIAPDYSAGHEKAAGFKKYFTAAGGKVVDEIYPPLTTNDFGPYLTKVAGEAKSIDGVWMFFAGSGSIRLINQYQEYGLKQKVPLFVIGDTVDDAFLNSMREAALDVKNYSQYAMTLKNPENQAFVKAYKEKYKELPSMFAEQGYVGAKVIEMALNAVKGNLQNKDAFLAALRNVKFNAPRGPFSFDANQNVILPVYFREVKKVNGAYENVVLKTISPDVGQNWSPDDMKK